MIEVIGLGRTYEVGGRPVHALRDVTETIEDGEHVAVMGPSGSGKTTLLNMIGCLDVPTAGSYRLDGREVANLDEEELSRVRLENFGFIFQIHHLVSRLDAAQNVELPMVLAGLSRTERRERAARALESVGMADRAGHRPTELSGGERQRVVIARAVVMNPRVLLADEPTGNLDRVSGDQVLDLLDRLRAEGRTLIVVTHDPVVARRADRIVVMVDGGIAHRLRSDDVERISDLFVTGTSPP